MRETRTAISSYVVIPGWRRGLRAAPGGGTNPTSWNYAHMSKGCSQATLQATGGDGLSLLFCY